MVAITTGLVILSALTTVILTTLHGSARVTARVHATQRARVALAELMEELHSACVTPEIAPVKEKSNGTVAQVRPPDRLRGRPTPILSVVSLSGDTLSQSDYEPTGGAAPNWTFSEETPSSTRTLLTGVAPVPPSSSIFSYYSYSGGTISTTPQTTPLSKAKRGSRSRSTRRSPPPPKPPRWRTQAPRRASRTAPRCASPRPRSTKDRRPGHASEPQHERGRLHDDHDRDRPLADRDAGAGRRHRRQRRHAT